MAAETFHNSDDHANKQTDTPIREFARSVWYLPGNDHKLPPPDNQLRVVAGGGDHSTIDFPSPYIRLAEKPSFEDAHKNGDRQRRAPHAGHKDSDEGSGGSSSDSSQDPEFRKFVTSETFKQVTSEVKQNGLNGRQITDELGNAMRANQVLAFGEYHDNPNPFREYGAQMMKTLKDNGATHFAVEAHDPSNPHLADAIAKFNETGDIEKLKQAYPPDARLHTSYFEMLSAAKQAGLTIVAADDPYAEKYSTNRDAAMSRTIENILASKNEQDPSKPNKVVFWVGQYHLSGETDTAADRLRNHGVALSTIEGILPSYLEKGRPIAGVLPNLDGTTLVDTRKIPGLNQVPDQLGVHTNNYEGRQNYILFFPK